jgi:hypothetical protein
MVTGNTSALRGKASFAGFAPTKAAQRVLAQAMARDLGPKGVHVAYFVIDAVIDVPWTRQMYASKPDDFFIQPAAIADEVWHVAHQDRSAWAFDVELRPFGGAGRLVLLQVDAPHARRTGRGAPGEMGGRARSARRRRRSQGPISPGAPLPVRRACRRINLERHYPRVGSSPSRRAISTFMISFVPA